MALFGEIGPISVVSEQLPPSWDLSAKDKVIQNLAKGIESCENWRASFWLYSGSAQAWAFTSQWRMPGCVRVADLLPAAPTGKKRAPAVKGWCRWVPTIRRKKSWNPETSAQIDVWHSLLYPWAAEVGQKLKRDNGCYLPFWMPAAANQGGTILPWARVSITCIWGLQFAVIQNEAMVVLWGKISLLQGSHSWIVNELVACETRLQQWNGERDTHVDILQKPWMKKNGAGAP